MKSIARKKSKQEFKPRVINDRLSDFVELFNTEPRPILSEVVTDTLFVFGYEKGDVLIIQPHSELVEDYLTIWRIKGHECLRTGYAYDNFDEISLITGETQLRFKPRDAELIGVVIGVIRKSEPKQEVKLIDSKAAKAQVDDSEITATCEGCGKTQTGSRSFLQSMAWRIRKDSTLCVHCW